MAEVPEAGHWAGGTFLALPGILESCLLVSQVTLETSSEWIIT